MISFLREVNAAVNGFVWDVADTFNGLMVVPNLLALFALSGTLVRILRGEWGVSRP